GVEADHVQVDHAPDVGVALAGVIGVPVAAAKPALLSGERNEAQGVVERVSPEYAGGHHHGNRARAVVVRALGVSGRVIRGSVEVGSNQVYAARVHRTGDL